MRDFIPLQNDGKETAKYWSAKFTDGLECLYGKYFSFSFAPHFHNAYTIGIIENGANAFNYRGSNEVASAGDIMLLNPAEVHTGKAADKRKGLVFRVLFVEPKLLKSIREDITGKTSDTTFFSKPVFHDGSTTQRVLKLHRALENAASTLECECLFLAAMAQLLVRYADSPTIPQKTGHEHEAVTRARDYLIANARENVTLDKLSRIAFLSPHHLLRVFHKATGLPPHAYQMQIRIEQAKEFLRSGFTISRTANITGFFDQAHFSKQFKRYVGTTPGQFLASVEK